MTKESLLYDSTVASIQIDYSVFKERGSDAKNNEYSRIVSAFEAVCNPHKPPLFILNGRAHQGLASYDGRNFCQWSPTAGGGGIAKIVIHPEDEPAQHILLKYTLAVSKENNGDARRAWLNVEFSPTSLLTGNNILPVTIEDSTTGGWVDHPSSSLKVMQEIYRLGFNVLEQMAQQINKSTTPLYSKATRKLIRSGRFHLTRSQWCAYLPTADRAKFLQVMAVLYGQTIGAGAGVITLATHLGLKFTHYTDESNEVTGLMLEKRHGNKSVFSIVPYDKVKRIADVRQGKTLTNVERSTVENNVRLDITSHSEGIVVIAKAAQKRLKTWRKEGKPFPWPWVEQFLTDEIKPQVWWLERAIFVLSRQWRDNVLVRGSFASWLVPYIIKDVLHLDKIGTFTSKQFHDFIALGDDIIVAWQHPDFLKVEKSWAEAIAELADVSTSTVYERRKEWIELYGIDIAIPFAFYRDLLYYARNSLTPPDDRWALVNAVKDRRGDAALRLLSESDEEFERQRLEIVGKVITAHPLKMKPKIVRIDRRSATAVLASHAHEKLVKSRKISASGELFSEQKTARIAHRRRDDAA
jgi:hypothetical protein